MRPFLPIVFPALVVLAVPSVLAAMASCGGKPDKGPASAASAAAAARKAAQMLLLASEDLYAVKASLLASGPMQVGKGLLKVIDPRSMRFEGLVSADRMSELKIG